MFSVMQRRSSAQNLAIIMGPGGLRGALAG
jgi:hypothetical protein